MSILPYLCICEKMNFTRTSALFHVALNILIFIFVSGNVVHYNCCLYGSLGDNDLCIHLGWDYSSQKCEESQEYDWFWVSEILFLPETDV